MAKLLYKNGITSVILRMAIQDVLSTTGDGLSGLTSSSTGLVISTIADNEATPTTYTAAGSTIETITTLGTFAAPTATKCRFKEVDATNHKGLYEVQIADARWAVSGARSVIVEIYGATNAARVRAEVQLRVAGDGSPIANASGYVTTTYQIKKNTALSNFMFLMTDSTNHQPATGLTVTGTVAQDGASFGALTNAVSEVGNGVYKVNLAAADVNANVFTLRFTATGADATYITVITQT